MKRLLERLGFDSPDEMEKAIFLKAQRNAYVFLMLSLVAWSLYESCKVSYHSRLNLMPCFLLVMTMAVQSLSQCIMTRNAVKEDSPI